MRIVHHAMPDLVGCALRSTALSRCGSLRVRPVTLCGAWAKVGSRKLGGSMRDEVKELRVYDVIRAQRQGWGCRGNWHGLGFKEPRRFRVMTFGGSRGQQLRCLSSQPNKGADQQSSKKYVPHLPFVTLSHFERQPIDRDILRLSSNLRKPLHEDIYTLPNALTVTRLVCAPAIGYLLLHNQHTWALGLFVYAGITDLLDGWVARRWSMQTVVGTVLDPMADKALMTIVVGVLGWEGWVPGKWRDSGAPVNNFMHKCEAYTE